MEKERVMKLYSNEIVFRGHPDKVCDQISGAILQEYVRRDCDTRAGIEVMGGKGKIFITGEVTSKAKVDIESVVKRVLSDVGYSIEYEIINNLGLQSPDISQGVDVGGAGDQGMMFGYACNDTEELLPTAMVILQKLSMWYDELRKNDNRFLPDGKAQITGLYDKGMKLSKIKDFVISYQNTEINRVETDNIIKSKAEEICNQYGITIDRFLINPTGKFLIGGFDGDAGLTGRKIVVDAYQSFSNVGGGCMNGKDCTKVDFSAAHKARELACRYLKANNLQWCEVQLSYAIGVCEPVGIYIDSNVGNLDVSGSVELFEECTPNRIISDLKLKEVDYETLAMFGHFTK